MRAYENFEQIKQDLQRLDLERKIALEELKIVKNNVEDYLKPLSLVKGFAKFVSKYSLFFFLKKIFK